ncbi:PHP domain-containing protein [Halanaerobium kushneri]|uniref:PHP domain-containing protein n=1 Tax=Halanaerobium kushneri TaxID=56779 RepID=A0A1N7CCW7_9FIRM|nr:PHP domain-containing protein [Halanaerobium kushneri]SIR61459.1 hypothetical protein SAMN05421834_1473 [Halanaerobium kushneri]
MNKYKIELHSHTAESSRCGSIEAVKAVKMYYQAGYSALVITDHYYTRLFEKISNLNWKEQLEKYLKGYRKAKRTAQDLDFEVFLGLEIKFTEDPNEYLVYGLKEDYLLNNPYLNQLSLKEFRAKTVKDDQQILVFQAHPFRKNMKPAADELLDGLEVYNGNPRHNSRNYKALEYARKHNLKMISGSDFHENEDLAQGGISTQIKLKDISDLLEVLKLDNYKLIKS